MSPLLRAFLRGQVFSAPPASALEWDCRVLNLTRGAARLILHRGCCPLPPAVREGSRFSMCRQHTFSRLLFYCGRPGGCEVFQRDTDSYFPHPETLTTFPRLLSICVSFFFFFEVFKSLSVSLASQLYGPPGAPTHDPKTKRHALY